MLQSSGFNEESLIELLKILTPLPRQERSDILDSKSGGKRRGSGPQAAYDCPPSVVSRQNGHQCWCLNPKAIVLYMLHDASVNERSLELESSSSKLSPLC